MNINRNIFCILTFLIFNCFILWGLDNGGEQSESEIIENSELQVSDAVSNSESSISAEELYEKVNFLLEKIDNLNAALSSSDTDIGSSDEVNKENENNFVLIPVIILLALIFLALIFFVIVFWFLKIWQLPRKIDDILRVIKDKPKTPVVSPSGESLVSGSASEQTSSISEQSSSSSDHSNSSSPLYGKTPTTASSNSSQPRPVTQPVPIASSDPISPLYSSKGKRDDRRGSSISDMFLDIDSDTYQQILSGDKVKLLFENRGGTYRGASFVYSNSNLYVNFYRYNEDNAIPSDSEKMLKEAFEIDGTLPGKIKKCTPAKMEKNGDKYFVVSRGKIELL